MGATLERIRAKVTRAKQHVQDFQLGLQAFYATNPYEVGIKEDPKSGKRIYYVTKADSVPDELTTIAADILQNLRTPLDQMAYQLVLDARGGTPPDWKVYYPISGSATDYPATRGGQIKGVRQEIIDAIDATEPYKGGKGHALWQLNELNKIDKHQLMVGACTVLDAVDLSPQIKGIFKWMNAQPGAACYGVDFSPLIQPFYVRPARVIRLNVGDELDPAEDKVKSKRPYIFSVSLYAPGIIEREPALKALQDFTNLIDEIILKLGRLLP